MVAIRAKHKSEEKYVSICFAILSGYLSWGSAGGGAGADGVDGGVVGGGAWRSSGVEGEEEGVFLSSGGGGGNDGSEGDEGDYCTVEVIELLCRSCMLPALASYLLNDSSKWGACVIT